jgi:signal transduction histidine kinase
MSAGLAHEIRNPLNVINMLLYAIQRQTPEFCKFCQVLDDISVLKNEVGRIKLLIDQFLDFARPSKLNKAPHDIKEILEEVLILTGYEAKTRGVKLTRTYGPEPLMLTVDGDKIKQVFLNLLLNAFQAIEGPGEVIFSFRSLKRDIRLDIQDTGSGVHPNDIPRLFIPFYTTKDKGLGLGLPLSARIIEEHGGKLTLEPGPKGKGTLASVFLPLDSR